MEKLFYQGTHITDFEAVVTGCESSSEENCFLITLDRTAFFPEEGGQTADKGLLGGQKVLDVRIENGVIFHLLPSPLSVGQKVQGQVDWGQRFDFMQQHSGEHIISGLVHSLFGLDNVGFHLSLKEVTLDFNGSLSLSQLRDIEARANAAVWANLPVSVSFPSDEELARLTYRSKIELTDAVRIVEIPGIDTCACCAPHVESTGQIGMIKITNVQSHRGGVRVNILCGGRALSDYTKKQDSAASISSLLSAKQDEITAAVKRLLEESAGYKTKANGLQERLLTAQLALLPAPCDTENALLFTEALDTIAMRSAVNSLTEKYSGFCGIFAGDDEGGYRFILGSSQKSCLELAQSLRQRFQAKCGGKAPMIQGSLTAPKQDIQDFFA